MALRKIVTLEDPVLRKTSRKVEKFDKRLWDLLDDMKDTLYSANGADVVLTMCDGKVLYRDGEWMTIDVEKAAADCDLAVDEILTALAAGE